MVVGCLRVRGCQIGKKKLLLARRDKDKFKIARARKGRQSSRRVRQPLPFSSEDALRNGGGLPMQNELDCSMLN